MKEVLCVPRIEKHLKRTMVFSYSYLRKILQEKDASHSNKFWDKMAEWNLKSNIDDLWILSGSLLFLALFVIRRLVFLERATTWLGFLFVLYFSFEATFFYHLLARREKISHLILTKNLFLYRVFHLLTIEWLFRTYLCSEGSLLSIVFIFPSLLHVILNTLTFSSENTKSKMMLFCVITTELQLLFSSHSLSLSTHFLNVSSMATFSILSQKVIEAQKKSFLTEKGLEQFLRDSNVLQKNTSFPIFIVDGSERHRIIFMNNHGKLLLEESLPNSKTDEILGIFYEPHQKEIQLAISNISSSTKNIIKTLKLLLKKENVDSPLGSPSGNQSASETMRMMDQPCDLSMTRSFHIAKESENIVLLNESRDDLSQSWVDVKISSIRWENDEAFLVCVKEAPPVYLRLKQAHLLSSKLNHRLFETLECFTACLIARKNKTTEESEWFLKKFADFSQYRLCSISLEEIMFFLSESFLIEEVPFNIRDAFLCVLLGNCLAVGRSARVRFKVFFDESLNTTGIGPLKIIEHLVSILLGIITQEGEVEKLQGKIVQKPGYEFAALSAEFRSFLISFEAKKTQKFNAALFHSEEITREKIINKLNEENDKKKLTIGFHKMLLRALVSKLRGKLLTKESKKHGRICVELSFPLKVRSEGPGPAMKEANSSKGKKPKDAPVNSQASTGPSKNFSLSKVLEQKFDPDTLKELEKLVILSPPGCPILLTWADRFKPVQKFIYDSHPPQSQEMDSFQPNKDKKETKKHKRTVVKSIEGQNGVEVRKGTKAKGLNSDPDVSERHEVGLVCSPIESVPQSPGTPFMLQSQESPNLNTFLHSGGYLKSLTEKSDSGNGDYQKALLTVIEDVIEEDMERDVSQIKASVSSLHMFSKSAISNSGFSEKNDEIRETEVSNGGWIFNKAEMLKLSLKKDIDDNEIERIQAASIIGKITNDFVDQVLFELGNFGPQEHGAQAEEFKVHQLTRGNSLPKLKRLSSYKKMTAFPLKPPIGVSELLPKGSESSGSLN